MNNTITDHINIWITAQTQKSMGRKRGIDNIHQHGVKRLRELILELAVCGKLVSQDPNDEPAGVLLKKIAEEKEKLIEEGQIKRQKPMPEIVEDEKPFKLPIGWEWNRLGECSYVFSGTSFKSEDFRQEGSVRAIKITNAGVGEFIETEDFLPDYFLEEYQDFIVRKEDLILALTRPYISAGLKISKCPISYDKSLLNQRVAAIRSFINTDFLFIYLSSNVVLDKYKERFGKSGLQPNLKMSDVIDLLIPTAPLKEQFRIVAKVDELMALCDKLEQQQTNSLETHQLLVETVLKTLIDAKDNAEIKEDWQQIESNFALLFTTEESVDLLKQTILQLAVMGKLTQDFRKQNPELVSGTNSARELLKKIAAEKEKLIKEGKIKKQNPLPEITDDEKPFNLSVGWEWCRLGTFTIVGTGSTPSRDKLAYYEPKEFHWVTSGETNQDFIFDTNEKISSLALKETNVSIYPKGSLIIAMYGQGKTRGQISELMIEAGTNQACAAVVLINKEESHRKYVKYFFKKAYEELRSHSAGGAQPNLNLGKVANTVIPIPPLSEQSQIVAKVDELFALCDALKERIVESQETKVKLADTVVVAAVKDKPDRKEIYTVNEQLSLAAEPE